MSASSRNLGHNNGPSMEPGRSWRRHSWARARADLLPNLPIEILRTRVRRAKELGLPYKTYASVRASTGRDVVAFLFSSNALRVIRPGLPVPQDRAAQLRSLTNAGLTCLTQPPHAPDAFMRHLAQISDIHLTSAGPAPGLAATWSDIRARVQAPIRDAGLPPDGVLVIGDTTLERDWSEAGRLAGFLPSDVYFLAPRGNGAG